MMRKILVVCDDRALAMLYSLELTEEGYDIVVAGNSSEVMESLERNRPDLVLVDWSMDRYRNSDFCRMLQGGPYRIPIIQCLDYPPTQKDLQFLGSDYFVLKSSNLKDLKTAIGRAREGLTTSGRPPRVVEPESIPPTQIPFTWGNPGG
jgi:CheY-like chemotaxis protein